MNDKKLVCVGDVMLERFAALPALPPINTTAILDDAPQSVGGTMFNLCWYFAHLDDRASVVGLAGTEERKFVEEQFRHAQIDSTNLLFAKGHTNSLIAITFGHDSYYLYFRQPSPPNLEQFLYDHCTGSSQLVLCGSRHSQIRNTFVQLAEEFKGEWLIFCPSYSIYEYSSKQLRKILHFSTITIINEQEAGFVRQSLEVVDLEQLAVENQTCVIVTYADKGAWMYGKGEAIHIPSLTKPYIKGDIIGAGDAFLAGLLHELRKGCSLRNALPCAATLAAIVAETGQIRPVVNMQELQARIATVEWPEYS